MKDHRRIAKEHSKAIATNVSNMMRDLMEAGCSDTKAVEVVATLLEEVAKEMRATIDDHKRRN